MAAHIEAAQERVDGWFVRNARGLRDAFRMIFGVVWLIDGSLKFLPGFVATFQGSISGQGQPAWLQGWFAFWSNQVNADPTFWVYMVGSLELLLGLGLLFGFVRKITYTGGLILSLFIWAVPEGFGGPYVVGTTDIGTTFIYAMVFGALFILDATYGPTPWSLDGQIERKWPGWKRIAEIKGFYRGPPAPGTER
jgi:uncharacterized membrane protein YphA (DoxX/SURF4 family)